MNITAGKYKGMKVNAPVPHLTRPTLSKVRMGVFNTLQSMIDFEACSFLDMFAGSGIMGLEALSRGFSNVYAIEKHPKVLSVIKSNFKKFKSPMHLISGDSIKIVSGLNLKFDVIYIDPPYFSGIYEQIFEALKDVASNIIIIEHVTDVDFSNFEILRQKKYGSKYITFLRK